MIEFIKYIESGLMPQKSVVIDNNTVRKKIDFSCTLCISNVVNIFAEMLG